MIVAGLTGSIGMGKSAVAAYMREQGVAVIDADKIVHDLYEGEAVALIEAAFPGATCNGRVDRAALGSRVIGSEEAIKTLENIVHPLVRDAEWHALKRAKKTNADLCVIEIPLLFETASHDLFDAILVASAPFEAQRERVLARPGMTAPKFDAILARQWPDAAKREKADYVVDTGLPLNDTYRQIDAVLAELRTLPAKAYERWSERSLR